MITVLVILATFLYVFFKFVKSTKRNSFPPGPDGVPIFGNVLQFTQEKFMLNMADVGWQYGDSYTLRLFNQEVVVLNSYDMIKEALSSPAYAKILGGRPPSFVGNHVLKRDEIFSTYSEEWATLRKLVIRGLKTYGSHLADVEDLVQEEIGYLISRIKKDAGEAIDPFVYISGYITSIVSMLLTGKHMKQEDEDLKLFANITDLLDYLLNPEISQMMTSLPWLRFIPFGCGKRYRQLKQYELLLKKNCNEISEKSERKFCFLDYLLKEKKKGNIAEESISGVMMDLLLAGTGTSRTALYSMFLILTARPDIQMKIQQEIDEVIGRSRLPCSTDKNAMPFTVAVMWETFRLYPSILMTIPRCTMEDMYIRDYFFPKDTVVFYNIWHVLHDEKFWKNPWEFNPSRFLDNTGQLLPPEDERRQRMIAFGVGKRLCLGEVLARLRIFLACVAVLQNFNLTPDLSQALPNTDPRTFNVSVLLFAPKYNIIFQPR